jgi:hypothetical protein
MVRRQETIRSLPECLSGFHPYLPREGQRRLAFCRMSSLRSHRLFALPFIPLAGYRSGLRIIVAGVAYLSPPFGIWSASISSPTA